MHEMADIPINLLTNKEARFKDRGRNTRLKEQDIISGSSFIFHSTQSWAFHYTLLLDT